MDICMLGQGRTIGRRFQCDLLTSINTFISVGIVGIIFCLSFAKYAAQLKLIPTVTFDTPEEDLTERENAMRHGCLVAEGWFARWYDLFLQYKPEILSLFAFESHIENKVNSLLEASYKEGVIRLGVHIRRGDYATWIMVDSSMMISRWVILSANLSFFILINVL